MNWWIQATLILIFSISNDWLSVIWHRFREEHKPLMASIVAILLGAISWAAIYWVVTESVWLITADLLGTFIGSYWGISHEGRRKTVLQALDNSLVIGIFLRRHK